MEKIPYGRYTKELREEAARLVTECRHYSEKARKSKITLRAWVRGSQGR